MAATTEIQKVLQDQCSAKIAKNGNAAASMPSNFGLNAVFLHIGLPLHLSGLIVGRALTFDGLQG